MSVLTAFDADVLIYAATQSHPHGTRVRTLFTESADVDSDADRFVTNNRKDFPLRISEVEITYPEMLPSPPG